MPNKGMGIDERTSYLAIQYERYVVADRRERSRLLDEMVEVTGLARETIIRKMRTRPRRKHRRKQRGSKYGADVQHAIHVVAEALEYPCAERLKPVLPQMSEKLAQHGHLHITDDLSAKLLRVSVSTVRRIRQHKQQDERRLARKPRSPNSSVQAQIPIRRIPWDTKEPGHFEVDLVHHCGRSTSGEYAHTLQMVDVATGWVEPAAMLGRSYRVTRDGFLRCLARVPFSVQEVHTDNGSEFMSHHMLHFWQSKYTEVDLSRIRPYKKRDNRFVEQRNGALIRAYVGHDRLDTTAQTLLLNRIYDRVWLYFNFFQPVMRQTHKSYEQGRVVRRHEDVRTPFVRACAMGAFSSAKRRQLEQLYDRTDPVVLHAELGQLLDQLGGLPCAETGQSEDIFSTLAFPETP